MKTIFKPLLAEASAKQMSNLNHARSPEDQADYQQLERPTTEEAVVRTDSIGYREDSPAIDPTIPRSSQPINPDAALKLLLEGNQRFVNGCQHPHQSLLRLQETSSAQYPFAAILGCADSRVPAEIIFDQGLGDLFVIRVAGSVACQTAIGSLEFATSVLGTQLIVVVGHSQCGAVAAATKGDPLPGRIGGVVEEIKPAIARVKTQTGDLQENAAIANVQYQVQKLKESSIILADLIQENKLKIVGGHYDLKTGRFSIVSGQTEQLEPSLPDRNLFALAPADFGNGEF